MEPARCGCIRPGAPAISCAYPVTAGAASRTVSPGLACAAIISVLEQSGALRGETPLPSLGFPRAAPAVWISLLRSQSRVQAFCLPPGGCFGRPGALRGRQARTGRAGGVSPRGSHLPVAPRRSLPGYLPASLSEARTGVLPPSRWGFGRPGGLRGRQACTGGAQGCFSPGSPLPVAPRRSLPDRLLGPAWDIPVLLSEPRTRFLPASRWVQDVREPCGAVRPAQGGAGSAFPRGLSPRRENVIAVGASGAGKTHAALGPGLAACHRGMPVGGQHGRRPGPRADGGPGRETAAQAAAAAFPPRPADRRGLQPALQAGLHPGDPNLPFDEWTGVFGPARTFTLAT